MNKSKQQIKFFFRNEYKILLQCKPGIPHSSASRQYFCIFVPAGRKFRPMHCVVRLQWVSATGECEPLLRRELRLICSGIASLNPHLCSSLEMCCCWPSATLKTHRPRRIMFSCESLRPSNHTPRPPLHRHSTSCPSTRQSAITQYYNAGKNAKLNSLLSNFDW